ncbi:MAG TPA: glycosyltransferase family A protein [Holophagaceae bacterium]|nr:glycosyltransferase family A protein [Holophagaceae bacterium]
MTWLDGAALLAGAAILGGLGLVLRNVRRLEDLPADPPPSGASVCLCIPARDEAREIRGALASWLAQDHEALRVVVVDDGSTDATPEILRDLAHPRLRVIRNETLPPGWLGKNHALDLAVRTREAQAADWLLFADADVHAAPGLLRRALAHAEAAGADVLALVPGQDTGSFGERLLLPVLAAGFLAAVPADKVAKPGHPAFAGIGAFTLVRRAAYEAIGGHAAAPLEAIDDMMLARRAKAAGFRNRLARGGPGLHLRMYGSGWEAVRALRKNALALPGAGFLFPLAAPLVLAVWLAPLWLPLAGWPILAALLWLLVPAVVAEAHQGLTGRPAELAWALWPLAGPALVIGALPALWDRIRGVNHWRNREVRVANATD